MFILNTFLIMTRRLTKKEKQAFDKMLQNDVSRSELKEKFNITDRKLTTLLALANRGYTVASCEKEILRLNKEAYPCEVIAEKLGFSQSSICTIFKRNNVGYYVSDNRKANGVRYVKPCYNKTQEPLERSKNMSKKAEKIKEELKIGQVVVVKNKKYKVIQKYPDLFLTQDFKGIKECFKYIDLIMKNDVIDNIDIEKC